MKTIRLYPDRYFRIQHRLPSNIILTIFSVYHAFGHKITSFLRCTDKRRPPGEPQGKFSQSWLDIFNFRKDKKTHESKIKNVPQRDMALAYAISNSDSVGVNSINLIHEPVNSSQPKNGRTTSLKISESWNSTYGLFFLYL